MKFFRNVLIILVSISAFIYVESNYAQERNSAQARTSDFRLPSYYGKIGVNADQRKKLGTIHASYEKKLAELRKQLKALVKERDSAMEAELTEGQKLRLKELRDEAIKNKPAGLKPKVQDKTNAE